jgi:hypothetical protein
MRYGLAPLPSRSASRRSTAASALSSNNPPYLVSVNATLLCPAHAETSHTCSAQRYGSVRRHRAAECDAAQCGPRHLWRLSTWVSSQASTAALRYLT